ncbi:MAG: hypothetical protein AB1Z98_26380 [Nannocystaceae bacterium]
MTTTQHPLRREPSRRPLGLFPARSAMLSLRSVARFVGAGCLLAVATGCPSPDPAGKYERFNEETEPDRVLPDVPPPVDFGEGQLFPDITGTFLVAIETSIAPGLPLQFLTDVQATVDEVTGDGTLTLSFQPLSLDVGSTTEPREEVGDPINVETPVTGGFFDVAFGETMVTGMANPITGSDILADISLAGALIDADAWCGAVTGEVLSPLQAPLDGSTYAAIRLADRSERPEMFPVKCDDLDLGGDETDGEDPTGDPTGTTGM